jgi:hypothetical protein
MPVPVGPRIRIADLIERAKEQGCRLLESTNLVATPWGLKRVRFLYSPANGGRFDLTDYNDDEFMLASEIDAAARRLGITLP